VGDTASGSVTAAWGRLAAEQPGPAPLGLKFTCVRTESKIQYRGRWMELPYLVLAAPNGWSSEWQIDHLICPLVDIRSSRDELQIRDEAPNRDVELMGINEPGKRVSCSLPPCRFGQQIFVLCNEHPSPLGGACEELGIEKLGGSIFLGSEDLDPRRRSPSITARGT
jgi:hypothetical protein